MSVVLNNVDDLRQLPEFSEDLEKNVPYIFNNIAIIIEYLAGETRTKKKDNGVSVSGIMPAAYGFILRTTDIHGEEIDMYLASDANLEADVYIIDQINPATGLFDEHKVMLGFNSIQDAASIYNKVFSDGSGKKRIGAISKASTEVFDTWLKSDGYSLQPASKSNVAGIEVTTVSGIGQPRPNPNHAPKPTDEAGGVIIPLPDISNGPKIFTTVDEDGNNSHRLDLISPIETDIWSNTFDVLCRILDLSSETDSVHIYIASPGGCVMLMGRVVSAIKNTKAKVYTYAQGCVASAATTIWAAGDVRTICPGAYFMQHMSTQYFLEKTTNIARKSQFCLDYISAQIEPLVEIGLFTKQEVDDMIYKASDIYISARTAIERVGRVSGSVEEPVVDVEAAEVFDDE